MKLRLLFERCLAAQYHQVENAADFAFEREGATLYIYFQQSRGCEDWENNLDFPIKPYRRMGDGCWFAHRGFLRVWKAVEPYIEPIVADRSIKRAVVVGYSHGAALAVFCHEYLWFHRPDLRRRLQGVGFGCPRVVWGALPKGVQSRWKNFTVVRNIDDIVTHLPPAALGYRHVGKLLEIGAKGRYSDWDAHKAKNIEKELLRNDI